MNICFYFRYPLDGAYDQRFNLSGQGLMPVAELNGPNSLWKQVHDFLMVPGDIIFVDVNLC